MNGFPHVEGFPASGHLTDCMRKPCPSKKDVLLAASPDRPDRGNPYYGQGAKKGGGTGCHAYTDKKLGASHHAPSPHCSLLGQHDSYFQLHQTHAGSSLQLVQFEFSLPRARSLVDVIPKTTKPRR